MHRPPLIPPATPSRYTNVKIDGITHDKLKDIAAWTGQSILDIVKMLTEEEHQNQQAQQKGDK